MAMVIIWIAVAILSLVDIQSNQQLFMSVTAWDHSARVNWTESILRTGIPPANPLYYYGHSAPHALLLFLECDLRCGRENDAPPHPRCLHRQLRMEWIRTCCSDWIVLETFSCARGTLAQTISARNIPAHGHGTRHLRPLLEHLLPSWFSARRPPFEVSDLAPEKRTPYSALRY